MYNPRMMIGLVFGGPLRVLCRWLAIAPLALALSPACAPTSVHPLSAAEKSSLEEKLIGMWQGKEGQREIHVEVAANPSTQCPGCMRATITEKVGKEENPDICAEFFSTHFGGKDFLNVGIAIENDAPVSCSQVYGPTHYFLVQYEISADGKLFAQAADWRNFKAAVDKGELEGEFGEKKDGQKPYCGVTSGSEKLRAFIEKNPDKFVIEDKDRFLTRVE